MDKTEAALLLSQLTYLSDLTDRLSGPRRSITEPGVVIELSSALPMTCNNMLTALKTLGLGLDFKGDGDGIKDLNVIGGTRMATDAPGAQLYRLFMDRTGVKKLIDGGVKNPVVEAVAQKMGIEIPKSFTEKLAGKMYSSTITGPGLD